MLIPEAELEVELRPELTRLLELKKTLPEMGMAPKIQIMNDYIERVMAKINIPCEIYFEVKIYLARYILFLKGFRIEEKSRLRQ